VQEAERRSLARELHDQIGQMLTGLQFTLESGKRTASKASKAIFDDAQDIISDLIKQVRDLSLRLIPSMLEDIGLLPTLEWHFQQYTNQTSIKVSFEHKGLKENRFPPNVEITAYRIIQEGLTNVARYAQVNNVNTKIEVEDLTLHLMITDKGVGFDIDKTITERKSFGLIGMKERVMLIGGDLQVKSSPGKGTRLEAYLPLSTHVERRKYAR
jgi:signal transduction histidine kinase